MYQNYVLEVQCVPELCLVAQCVPPNFFGGSNLSQKNTLGSNRCQNNILKNALMCEQNVQSFIT